MGCARMSGTSPCGDVSCPVRPPDAAVLRRVRGTTWPAGTVLRRGHKSGHPADGLVPGVGHTRLAPLDSTGHAYVAGEPVAALLESVLHDVSPIAPRVRHAAIVAWSESQVVLARDVRLADLTDPELARLGVARDELVATSPRHYPCTRRWAAALQGRRVGGHTIAGMVWDSRRQELHAAAMAGRPAVQSILRAADARVAVIWAPPLDHPVLTQGAGGLGPLAGKDADAFLTDLAAVLGIVTTA